MKLQRLRYLAEGILFSAFYGFPARKLKIIGVTGTDGKTTTVNLIYQILITAGKKVSMISTVNAKIGFKPIDTGLHTTTPRASIVQKLLRQAVKAGCEYMVIETTSHGLEQERLFGIKFDVGVLTNITHEHLDYHGTFREYVKAKSKLFQNSKISILNKEDNSYHSLKKLLEGRTIIKAYSSRIEPKFKKVVEKRFLEPYNHLNCSAAITVAETLEIVDKNIIRGIKNFQGVPGRMEEIENNKGIRIFVDFAHTPNALLGVLSALRRQTKGRLIAVFGCAGERDKAKRFMMGMISAKIADISVYTAEDPRNEDVNSIIKQIVKGATKAGAKELSQERINQSGYRKRKHLFLRISNRKEAIACAINRIANKKDVIVICGKGHEKSMAFSGVEYPWSDKKEVKAALAQDKEALLESDNIAVLGFGLEGKDLVRDLIRRGKRPTILDERKEEDLDFEDLSKSKIRTILGPSYLNKLGRFKTVYRSPGVYRYKKEILKAEKAGVEISSATKLFFDLCPGRIIGVTGTKGKGTACTLIYEILKKSGKDVLLAGNIGKPYLELLPKLRNDSWIVLELSSFQLIDLKRSPYIAVVLNITSDHLDWHNNQREYVNAKKNIVKYQNRNSYSVINGDYKSSLSFAKLTQSRKFYISRKKKTNGCYVKNGEIILDMGKEEIIIGKTDKLFLRGEHNWENIAAAICASYLAGAGLSAIRKVIYNFKGLEHRLELVKKVKGITFYNDSFSTGPESAIAAVRSFKEPLTVILGGYDKGLEYDEMAREFAKKDHIISTILIGDLQETMNKLLVAAGFPGRIIKAGKLRMSDIVKRAVRLTPKGGVILLSPAAASFDMFKDYKERGNLFKEAVKSL